MRSCRERAIRYSRQNRCQRDAKSEQPSNKKKTDNDLNGSRGKFRTSCYERVYLPNPNDQNITITFTSPVILLVSDRRPISHEITVSFRRNVPVFVEITADEVFRNGRRILLTPALRKITLRSLYTRSRVVHTAVTNASSSGALR